MTTDIWNPNDTEERLNWKSSILQGDTDTIKRNETSNEIDEIDYNYINEFRKKRIKHLEKIRKL